MEVIKRSKQREMEAKLTVIIVTVLSKFLFIVYAAPVCVPRKPIDHRHVGLCLDNRSVNLWECPICFEGQGLSVECGRMYNVGTKIHCVDCKEGVSFSSKPDTGQCRPCTRCSPNEVQVGKCGPKQNNVTCHCKSGYYREKLSRACKPCSYCCGDKRNNQEEDCKIPEVLRDRRCSYLYENQCSPTSQQTTTPTLATVPATAHPATPTDQKHLNTTTKPSIKGDLNMTTTLAIDNNSGKDSPETPKNNNNGKDTSQYVLVGVGVGIGIIIFLVFSLIVYLCKNNNSSGSSAETTECSAQTCNESRSSMLLEEQGSINGSKVNVPNNNAAFKAPENVPLLTTVDQGNGKHNSQDQTESISNGLHEASNVVTDSEPTAVVQDDGTVIFSRPVNHFQNTEHLNTKQPLDLLVTQLPLKLYSKVCAILDAEDPFFRDYRMLAEKLGVSSQRIRILGEKKTQQPTDSLLLDHKLNLKAFMEILKEIEREDVSELIESWLAVTGRLKA